MTILKLFKRIILPTFTRSTRVRRVFSPGELWSWRTVSVRNLLRDPGTFIVGFFPEVSQDGGYANSWMVWMLWKILKENGRFWGYQPGNLWKAPRGGQQWWFHHYLNGGWTVKHGDCVNEEWNYMAMLKWCSEYGSIFKGYSQTTQRTCELGYEEYKLGRSFLVGGLVAIF